jgi:hypothetical protein
MTYKAPLSLKPKAPKPSRHPTTPVRGVKGSHHLMTTCSISTGLVLRAGHYLTEPPLILLAFVNCRIAYQHAAKTLTFRENKEKGMRMSFRIENTR